MLECIKYEICGLARYDPPVQTAFESWTRKTDIGDGTTVWNWLNGAELKATPTPPSAPSAPSETPSLASFPTPGVHAQIPPEIIGADEQLAGMNRRASEKVAAHEAEIMKLPHERCLVFDENGNVLMHRDGDAGSIILNHEEQREIYGRVLTHNHPKGGTFTLSDVTSACLYFAAELRAVSPWNTISLRGGSRALDPTNFEHISKAVARLSGGKLTPANAHAVWKKVAEENGLNYVFS